MIKFEVLNRFTSKIQFVAEIDCNDDAIHSIKLGLAVKWACKNNADLFGANLRNTDLFGSNLRDADLSGTDLRGSNLRGSDLSGSDLSGSDLRDANLSGSDLRDANLSCADLRGANLIGADLRGADLSGANLSGANLRDIVGEKKHIKTLQIEDYSISYTSEILQIGCQRFPIAEWWELTDAVIVQMDDDKTLAFWRKWKDWLRDLIEVRSPAKPTEYEEKEGEVK